MQDEKEANAAEKPAVYKRGRLIAEPGKPVRLVEEEVVSKPAPESSIGRTISRALKAYRRASSDLTPGKYAHLKQYAPPQLREPCHIYVFVCTDGVLVRYDPAGSEELKVFTAEMPQPLEVIAPQLSEGVVYFSADPTTFVPPTTGPGFALLVVDAQGNATTREHLHPTICGSTQLPASFVLQPAGTRPPTLAAINSELAMFAHGVELPVNTVLGANPSEEKPFVISSKFQLQVGWRAIEAYPLLGEDYWQKEFAPLWAEIDILFAAAHAQAPEIELNAADGLSAERARYARILAEFNALLSGPEEPVHQFLRVHPHLISQTFTWRGSKLPFGNELVSDFVFREPPNDYLLVELESPQHELFTKNGDQRVQLNHAIQQTSNWVRYIADNKRTVEDELELVGISATPRRLVVIGRSASLTERDRRTLSQLMSDNPHLTILTYDDMIDRAKANLERLLGSLSLQVQNARLYYPKPAE